MSTSTHIPSYMRFAIAGSAGSVAAILTHPTDVVKYRMQLSGKGGTKKLHKTSVHAVYNIAKTEGIVAIYSGLSASVLRQLTLTMTRFGLYSAIVDNLTEIDGTPPSLLTQTTAGVVTGAMGAVAGNPADIALVRMASDGGYPPNERYNYKNCFNAINRIRKEEGITTLWTGVKPNCVRTMILNMTQMVLYKNVKVLLLQTGYFKDNTILHVSCSGWTAFATTFATGPVDITKTRLMAMKVVNGKPEYSGMIDVWRKVIKYEGVPSLWKGLTPTFVRVLPNNFIFFALLESLTKYYKKIVLGDKSNTGF